MAHSHRRTPIISMMTSATRRAVKRDTDPDATVLPIMREVSDEWAMAKDGRSWFGRDIPKLMRK